MTTTTGVPAARPAPEQATLSRALAAALALGAACVLGGCGSVPPAPPSPPAMATPQPAAADPALRQLAEFEARLRAVAETASAQGRWAEALNAIEVLRALKPGDMALQQQLARAQLAAAAAARERLQRGRQAAQRGDGEAASRAYLEALVLAPDLTEAADALRTQERERVRRQHLGKLSRYAMGNTAASLQADPPSQAVQAELEHASLLADQGEFEGAIATLKPLADKRGADAAVISLLAEIYFRAADAVSATNRPAALAALDRCLQLDRSHPLALALQKQLTGRN